MYNLSVFYVVYEEISTKFNICFNTLKQEICIKKYLKVQFLTQNIL